MVHSIDTTESSRQDVSIPLALSESSSYSEGIKKVANQAALVLKSPLVWTFGGILSSYYFLPAKAVLCILGGVVGGMIVFPEYIPKALFYEGVMVDNLARSFLTKCGFINSPYYSHIDAGIYVGALPLRNFGHDQLLASLNIHAVLAVVEDYEFEQKTFLSEAVQVKDWENRAISVLQIPVVDLNSVSIEDLHRAADFIQLHRDSIYVHCKAGRGRSMMCILAYLMKYQNMTYDKAIDFAKEKRPCMSLKPWQLQRLQEFEQRCFNEASITHSTGILCRGCQSD